MQLSLVSTDIEPGESVVSNNAAHDEALRLVERLREATSLGLSSRLIL